MTLLLIIYNILANASQFCSRSNSVSNLSEFGIQSKR
jgi:hypothetical protein